MRYQMRYGADEETAHREAVGTLGQAEDIVTWPGQRLTWLQMGKVRRHLPEAYEPLWARMIEEAEHKIAAGNLGHLHAETDSPWSKAVYLALRKRFMEEYQPVGGIGTLLVETLAETFLRFQFWAEMEVKWGQYNDDVNWLRDRSSEPPTYRIDQAKMIELASRHAEQAHKQFTRTLRSLQSWGKHSVSVTVNGPANVNLGQQVISPRESG